MKQALATQPDLKLLLIQYVSTEVSFGGSDFVAFYREASRQDAKYKQAIGQPSIFLFTAKGDAVYAGPNTPNGMPPGEEFKKLLITGIEKNGGLRSTIKSPAVTSLAADVAKARKLLSENQPLAAAAIISRHVPSENVADETAEVSKLTGLKLARSKTEEQLDSLVQQVSEKGLSLLQAAVAAAGTGDTTSTAVQIAELNRIFVGYPLFAGKFEAAWNEILSKADVPNLKEQAELIDKARRAEAEPDPAQAIAAYGLVATTYPSTKAAELSQLRITQLRALKPTAPRLWKNKSGQFSVTATLVGFDGKSAHLRTHDGKTITVALDTLSTADPDFLKVPKP